MIDRLRRLFRYRDLMANLVLKDLRLKYRSSVFGFLWSLVNPLVLIATYVVAFKFVIRLRVPGADYVLFLIVGVLHWNFFALAVSQSVATIVANAGLIRATVFPRLILPLSGVGFCFIQYLLTLAVFLPAAFFYFEIPLGWHLAWFFPLIALWFGFVFGLALIVGTATVFFRDVQHFVEVGLMVGFWLTPIIYALPAIPPDVRPVLQYMPTTPFIVGFQDIFVFATAPTTDTLAFAALHTALMLALGALVFGRFERSFAEEV